MERTGANLTNMVEADLPDMMTITQNACNVEVSAKEIVNVRVFLKATSKNLL